MLISSGYASVSLLIRIYSKLRRTRRYGIAVSATVLICLGGTPAWRCFLTHETGYGSVHLFPRSCWCASQRMWSLDRVHSLVGERHVHVPLLSINNLRYWRLRKDSSWAASLLRGSVQWASLVLCSLLIFRKSLRWASLKQGVVIVSQMST